MAARALCARPSRGYRSSMDSIPLSEAGSSITRLADSRSGKTQAPSPATIRGSCRTRLSDPGTLFDHLVGTGKHGRRNGEAEGPGGFEVDHQLILRRLLIRQISRTFATEDAVDIGSA